MGPRGLSTTDLRSKSLLLVQVLPPRRREKVGGFEPRIFRSLQDGIRAECYTRLSYEPTGRSIFNLDLNLFVLCFEKKQEEGISWSLALTKNLFEPSIVGIYQS